MDITTLETLETLRQAGINVARTKIVDSAEDAIAFAQRPTARDARIVPIVLRYTTAQLHEGGRPSEEPLRIEPQIRSAYERLRRAKPERAILVQAVTPLGTDVFVSGNTDESCRVMTIHGGTTQMHRIVPLGENGAELLAAHLQGPQPRGSSEEHRRLLERLLLRLSDLFETSGMHAFGIFVRLHENSYTVVDGSISAHQPLYTGERLASR
jgi:hypothetical protein